MMHIHFIIHEVFEAPGAFLTWAEKNIYTITTTKIYEYDKLPDSVNSIDLLVIMGGPQSPNTTMEECAYYDAKAEISFIKKTINAQKSVVGVCLGAQLIGEALGAKVQTSPEKEIGKFPITLTENGLTNPKFLHFGKSVEVGHWHGDMPGLTDDCNIIAYSEGCPRQIVEYGNLIYGFQCHLEFTPETMQIMIKYSQKELTELTENKYVQSAEQLQQHNFDEMNKILFLFLDKLIFEYRQVHKL